MAERLITEQIAVQQAVEQNYFYFGGYEDEILKNPSDNASSRLLTALGTVFVSPSDLFLIIACWYCGVGTPYSIASMLHKMRDENPDKSIIDVSLKTEAQTGVVYSRLKKLEKCGVFLKRRVSDKESARNTVTYTVLPEMVRFAFSQLEIPISVPSYVINSWADRKEFTRQLLVSRWIAYNMESVHIRHFKKYRKIPRSEGRGVQEFTYLWFSSEKNGKRYSVMVYPFVFEIDSRVNNEYENEIYNVEIPFQKLNDFLRYCDNGEDIGALILLVDREQDFLKLSNYVKQKIPEKYHENILISSNGLIGSQMPDTMYFNVRGSFYDPEKRMF